MVYTKVISTGANALRLMANHPQPILGGTGKPDFQRRVKNSQQTGWSAASENPFHGLPQL